MLICLFVELSTLLLEQKADVSITTTSGDSVLHAGVYGNNATIVDHLIAAGKFIEFREYFRGYPEFPWNIPLPAISVHVCHYISSCLE